jgi:peroxiredoxin
MVVDNGVVTSLNLEEGAAVDKSSAATVCGML